MQSNSCHHFWTQLSLPVATATPLASYLLAPRLCPQSQYILHGAGR